jgi:uncharacterized protein
MVAGQSLLGRTSRLIIERVEGARAHLRPSQPAEQAPAISIETRELPKGAAAGDVIEAFVRDAPEGQWVATSTPCKLEVGQVAFLRVKSSNEAGAWVEWGLAKDLLVPMAEQARTLRVGELYPIGLIIDRRGRLTGTARFRKLLDVAPCPHEPGEWLEGEAWRNEPGIGLFAIVGRRWVGLVPASEPHTQKRGQAARYRISQILEDGKLELSLRGTARDELDKDAARVLEILQRANTPKVGDDSPPEQIRQVFGLSKKAFKRALGVLLKRDAIRLDGLGFAVAQKV